MNETEYMEIAIKEAQKGVLAGDGGPFGAVIVYEGEVISKSHNEVVKQNDPTAHAEVLAIREAGKKLERFHLKGCTLYCTGEPCPMCFSAIHWAHIDKVVYCNTKDDASKIGFDDNFITEIIKGDKADPIPFIHHPAPACAKVLKIWQEKDDKVLY